MSGQSAKPWPSFTYRDQYKLMDHLKRELGMFDATLLGLGSIVGTGIFVSLGIATALAGPWVLLAIFLASLVALCNGLSSAQLAAAHPVSGGTYEYANRWLNPTMGFIAGWTFLVAKSASAATAAIGFSQYVLPHIWMAPPLPPTAILLLSLVTLVFLLWGALCGIKRSATVNAGLVVITVGSLVFFIVTGAIHYVSQGPFIGIAAPRDLASPTGVLYRGAGLWEATSLMFVAYTGYGRIATLGEEVREPQRTIPRAILTTLIGSMVLYFLVALIAIANDGVPLLASAETNRNAALQIIAGRFSNSLTAPVIVLGATVSLLGVLFNLILGLSRVALAMARRGELPTVLAQVDPPTGVPKPATIFVAVVIGILVAVGIGLGIKTAWSISAFSVLVYYGITNACVLTMEPQLRLYGVWPAWIGLAACLSLAFCVSPTIWISGLALIALGLAYRMLCLRLSQRLSN